MTDTSHASDYDLERYHLGMIQDEGELVLLEEHLLCCPSCVDRAEQSDKYVDAMRRALSELRPDCLSRLAWYDCALNQTVAVLRSRSEIERILLDDLARRREAYDEARKGFDEITSDIPSGLPHPDGTTRIQNAGRANALALDAYVRALREFNEFAVHKKVPDRLNPTS